MAGRIPPRADPRTTARVEVDLGYAAFRDAARRLLIRDTPPAAVRLLEQDPSQLSLQQHRPRDGEPTPPPAPSVPIIVPREFVRRARRVVCHRDPDRLDLLYRVLWRVTHGERNFLREADHPDVRRFGLMDTAVLRDLHELRARLRLTRVTDSIGGPSLVAFATPAHRTLRLVAPELVQRHPREQLTVFTPDDSFDWDGERLTFGPGTDPATGRRPQNLLVLRTHAFARHGS